MINENSLAIYKDKPALVKERSSDKITVALSDETHIKVREKDIEIIHPGPVYDFTGINVNGNVSDNVNDKQSGLPSGRPGDAVREAWELLVSEQEKPVSLKELAELSFGEYSPASAWDAYRLILDGLYFTGTVHAVLPRRQNQVEADEKRRKEKQQASGERERFLERLKNRRPQTGAHLQTSARSQTNVQAFSSEDLRFMQDVEALALGKSVKSKTMKDINEGETPEEAHALLLDCGFWTKKTNPYPTRHGVSLTPAEHVPDPPPPENRRDLTCMTAFAIDNPQSHDPDDAVSLEIENGKRNLYVHVADPSASVGVDDPVEREARDRGATLYIPEGNFPMISEKALPVFALGLAETSPALTFKMTLNSNGEIEETEIFPSTVKVSRLTYEYADELMSGAGDGDAALLRDLHALAENNFRRRAASGAINIDLPETRISLEGDEVIIEPVVPYRSESLVRECMLLAGEGAGIWAVRRKLPVPFAGQETEDMPDEILPGIAGAFQTRRYMRQRYLSASPKRHEGLGLEAYVQVTSPLRRYNDLLAHIQIRALLRGGIPVSADEISKRTGAGEAATAAVNQAERASRNHWTMVYLSDKENTVWEAVALEKKGYRQAFIVPALALETQTSVRGDIAPNDPVRLVLKSVNIPKGEAVFVIEE